MIVRAKDSVKYAMFFTRTSESIFSFIKIFLSSTFVLNESIFGMDQPWDKRVECQMIPLQDI